MRPSKLCFSLQSMRPRMEETLPFPPCCLLPCYYKLAAGCGNLWDQSRQAEKLRTQEMHWADSGCIKSPRCRSPLSKTRRFFWSGLDVWVCSWGTAQLESWEIIHIALGLKVLIWEGNAQERGRESHTLISQCGHGEERGERPRTGREPVLVESVF